MKLVVNTDGGSRGNPGPAAAAFVVKDEAENLLEKRGNYLGHETNNVAEYVAILNASNWLVDQKTLLSQVLEVVFRLDSELVVRQINGVYKVKNKNLQDLREKVIQARETFLHGRGKIKVSYVHVPRDQNAEADALVNETLDQAGF